MFQYQLLILLASSCGLLCKLEEDHVTVRTGNVVYRGRIVKFQTDKTVAVYLKIPFAKPPIGQLRFQPLDITNFTSLVDSTGNFSKKCIQPLKGYDVTTQSEDCLYLNVFTPKLNNADNLYPVMVWIHGGAFVSGSASDFGIDGILRNLVSRDVIVVTINYRLGPFGFWNTKSSVVPGNFGLWDQLEALRWVRNNIQVFGGDPGKVTIFGESAGGASTSLLSLSPSTRGLFSQAIMMSGSGLAHWALTYDDDSEDPSGYLSEDLNCRPKIKRVKKLGCFSKTSKNSNDTEVLDQNLLELECMKQKSVLDILKHAKAPGSKASSVHTIWTPRIDGDFLPESPEALMESRPPYKLMIGITKDDGALFAFADKVFTHEKLEKISIPSAMDCQVITYPDIIQPVIKYKYSYSITLPSGVDDKYFWMKQDTQMKTNSMFLIPAYKEALGALKTNSTIYLYSWDYGEAGELYNAQESFYFKGPFHATEQRYLFDLKTMFAVNESVSQKNKTYDEDAINMMGTLWTNFAKFGNPTPQSTPNSLNWSPMLSENLSNYFSIDFPNSRMINNFYKDDVIFWHQLIPELENNVKTC